MVNSSILWDAPQRHHQHLLFISCICVPGCSFCGRKGAKKALLVMAAVWFSRRIQEWYFPLPVWSYRAKHCLSFAWLLRLTSVLVSPAALECLSAWPAGRLWHRIYFDWTLWFVWVSIQRSLVFEHTQCATLMKTDTKAKRCLNWEQKASLLSFAWRYLKLRVPFPESFQ